MRGGEDMDAFDAELQRRGDGLLAGRNFGYSEDYRDPEYDGTVEGFRDVVLPARIEAIQRSLNGAFADLLPEGCRFTCEPAEPSKAGHVMNLVQLGHFDFFGLGTDTQAALDALGGSDGD